jgi:hypothetical protein
MIVSPGTFDSSISTSRITMRHRRSASILGLTYAGGRANLLGVVIDRDGVRYDIQLRDTGLTPFPAARQQSETPQT